MSGKTKGWLFVAVVVGIGVWGAIAGHQGGGGATGTVTGTLDRWAAIDSAHGYASFTLTNSGDSTVTATCTVEVSDDFGDIGYDQLAGVPVPAYESVTGRIALTVTGNGAANVNNGTVKDC